jgi:hypothetical protein
MIFFTKDGRDVGHAIFSNGFYYLEVKDPEDAGQDNDLFKIGKVVAAIIDFNDPV